MFRNRLAFSAEVPVPAVHVARPERIISVATGLILGVILVAGLGLRAVNLEHEQLWTDEIFSATFAVQPLIELIIANLRFDAHPPLYHLQLHLWSLISQSTLWLYINSLAWSWLAVLVLWRCSQDFLAPIAVVVATALFAAMPVGVEWAHNLRMYGMLAFISILIWFFCYRFFTQQTFKKSGVIVAVLMLITAYSHVGGLLILGYAGVYSVCIILQNRPDRVRIWWWGKMYVVTGLLVLPAAINLLARDTLISAPLPTPAVLVHSLAYLIAGPATRYGWMYPVVSICGIFIIIGFLADPKIRALFISFVATPIVLAILVSFLIQPMWITRMLFCAPPILAITAAQGIFIIGRAVGNLAGPLARQIAVSFVAALLTAGLGAASLWAAENVIKPTNYLAAAQEIRAGLKQGDIILVPETEAFWGLAWYLIGPDWGSPLAVQDVSPESLSEKWTNILNWLGPVWRPAAP
jgi:mannosyltransferase